MSWTNSDILLYHGTDGTSAKSILANGLDPLRFSQFADFGPGFYTTTNLIQARKWARLKSIRTTPDIEWPDGCVIQMQIERQWLASLRSLVFLRSAIETGWQDFVRYNRTLITPDFPGYEVVYGPVSIWKKGCSLPETQIEIHDNYDQISFHNPDNFGLRGPLLKTAVQI